MQQRTQKKNTTGSRPGPSRLASTDLALKRNPQHATNRRAFLRDTSKPEAQCVRLGLGGSFIPGSAGLLPPRCWLAATTANATHPRAPHHDSHHAHHVFAVVLRAPLSSKQTHIGAPPPPLPPASRQRGCGASTQAEAPQHAGTAQRSQLRRCARTTQHNLLHAPLVAH